MQEKKTGTIKPPPPAREAALRLLSRREHSAQELKRKLVARGVEASGAADAVAALAARDLQSDARYADQVVRTRIAQGYGPRRIRAELEHAGLTRDSIRQSLEHAGCDWSELAQRTLQRKFRGAAALRRKQWQFLHARGFETREIESALGDGNED